MKPSAYSTFNLEQKKRALFEKLLHQENLESTSPATSPAHANANSVPLSFGQERLWFLDQLQPGNCVYNIPIAWRIRGELNGTALERSLGEIVRRHEMLRSIFADHDGLPVQIIQPYHPFKLAITDLTARAPDERETLTRQLASNEVSFPFDLRQGPLLRARLLQLEARDQVLLLCLHHIAADGWSIGILWTELSALYTAFNQGQSSPLAEISIQYADYAIWQRDWLQGAVLDRQLAYWKQQLAGCAPRLELPTDGPRPAVQSHRGAQQSRWLPKDLVESLKSLSRRERVTLYMTLLAAWQTQLHRYSGQEDILVGSPVANRNRMEIEGLIGFFVNTLVLRTSFVGDPTFRELLGRVREVALGAFGQPDLPFERLVEELQPKRDPSHSPLFQVLFVLQNTSNQALNLPGLTVESLEVETRTAKFDLTLTVTETAEGLQGTWEYNTDLYQQATIERMIGHCQILLEGIVANPEQRVSRLPLLAKAEQRQMLIEWNDTRAEFPLDTCIHQWFEAQVERTPEAVAVEFQDQQLTYRELNQRANQLAHHLRQWEVGPDVVVGLCLERSLELVVGLLGVLKAGGAYVPLDPAYPPARLRYLLEDCQATILLTRSQDRLPNWEADRAALAPPEVQAPRRLCLDTDWTEIATQSRDNPEPRTTPDHLAYVIYTSGSTGQPKGVMIPHRALCNHMLWMQQRFPLGESDRVLQKTPISFDASVWEFYAPWLAGARLVLARPGGHQDPAYLVRTLAQHQITILQVVPTLLGLLLAQEGLETCRSLRRVFCGGEVLTGELALAFFERWPAELCNLYGPTEACIDATYYVCPRGPQPRREPIGRPIANLRAYVLDRQQQPAPIGVPGELYLGGAGLARGYWHRPEATAERFVADPFSTKPGARLYRTGDQVRYRSDGQLEFLGRLDQQVKLRGQRIEPGEIEAVLRQEGRVRECAVVAREEGGESRLVAYVAPRAPGEAGEPIDTGAWLQDLRRWVARQLPASLAPSAYVVVETLPLLPNGKVDRRALPAPEGRRPELEPGYVAPRTPVEARLAGLWEEVLGLDQVGVQDNFFELGGHSLMGARVIARIRKAAQLDLPLRLLFEQPTVAGLAAAIENSRRGKTTVAREPHRLESRPKELPLSFAQERLWFLDHYEPGCPVYNIPLAIELSGPIEVEAMEWSLNEIIRRHEVLRTTFPTVEGRALQVIAPPEDRPLVVVDLSTMSRSERSAAQDRCLQAEAREPFNLAEGPLMRLKLLRLEAEEHLLLLTMHHIVADGWSLGILKRELGTLYQAHASGRISPLNDLPLQYADFALWQREWLQGEVLERQRTYWRHKLENAPPVLQLPTDHARPAQQTCRGARCPLALSPALSTALTELSRREGVTVFMVLLAGFQAMLHRYTGQTTILVGTPIANRNRAELEGLIGFFANTLVLETDVSGDPTVRELLDRVRTTALEAYEHQDFPFEQLVAELRTERDLSRSPLFQVMLIWGNTPGELLRLPGLRVNSLDVDNGTSKFDLTLILTENAGRFQGAWEFNTDLFERATIERMTGHWLRLLEGLAAQPEQRVSALPLLTEAERRQVLVEWNHTQAEFPQDRCIHQWFEIQAERTPEAVAVEFEDQQLTYRALNQQANRLAHRLHDLGVGPEVPVGMCVDRSLEMVVGLLAILKAGGTSVPLDAAYPKDRLAFMLNDSRAPVLLTLDSLRSNLPPFAGRTVFLEKSAPEAVRQPPSTNLASGVTSENLVYLLYTSGSTGRPKGVAMPHRALVNLITWQVRQTGFKPGARTLQFASLSFDVSFQEIFSTWCSGGTLILIDDQARRDPNELWRRLLQQQVERLFVPFVALEQMSLTAEEQRLDGLRLQEVITAGEQLQITPSLSRLFSRLRHCTLCNQYGPTESHVVTAFTLAGPPENWPLNPPIGRPVANTQIYLLDASFQPVPVGVAGELFLGGIGLARGYLNQPGLTAERFLRHPFSDDPQARLYRTGDRARCLPDGNLEFLGRLDDQVKIRGFRVEPGEIESVLRTYEPIRECAVVAREDLPGDKRLVAYVVPRWKTEPPNPALASPGSRRNPLRDWLSGKLPDYMIPSAFVPLDQLPLTPSGKVDRRALPAPDRTCQETPAAPMRPWLELHREIIGLWEELLGVSPIGLQDDFFELGGHSLLAVRMLRLVERKCGQALSLATLFAHATVEHLTEEILKLRRGGPSSTVLEVQAQGSRPPLFLVGWGFDGLRLVRCLSPLPDQPMYLMVLDELEKSPAVPDIAGLARAQIDQLRRVRPQGPYALGGYCFGGVIAFEMAHELLRLGEKVDQLFLIESYPPTRSIRWTRRVIEGIGALVGMDEAQRLQHFEPWRNRIGRWQRWRRLEAKHQARGLQALILRKTREWLAPPSTRPPGRLPPGSSAPDSTNPGYVRALYAMAGHTMRPYSGKVELLVAGDPFKPVALPPPLWRRCAPQANIRMIPGDHGSCVGAHLEALVHRLKESLVEIHATENRRSV